MTETNTTNDVLNFPGGEQEKLPGGLNVLTILSIIGSVLAILGSLWSFFTARKNYDKTKEMLDSGKMDNAPSWAKSMMNPDMLAMQQKMVENRFPIMILGLVGGVLCLYGAMEMRKRKKQGFTLWLVGELLPIATGIFFIGTAALKGFGLIGVIIPIIFIALYAANRKYLVN